jgi:hypothetical protein
MSITDDLLGSFEVHSPKGIREALDAGASPIEPIRGKKPIECLIEMYTRSPGFGECLQLMLNAGSVIGDPLLEAVLFDDDASLRRILKASGDSLERKFYLECAYTSLQGVSTLHVCAEYNSVRCAGVLIDAGMDVNVGRRLIEKGSADRPLYFTQ